MSTSHYSSRPSQNDVGADTIRIPITDCPPNTRKHTRLAANIWLLVGIVLLLADGTAMYHFADSPLEATIIALLTMPTGILVILAALEARK
jgi:hypothetical protein